MRETIKIKPKICRDVLQQACLRATVPVICILLFLVVLPIYWGREFTSSKYSQSIFYLVPTAMKIQHTIYQ